MIFQIKTVGAWGLLHPFHVRKGDSNRSDSEMCAILNLHQSDSLNLKEFERRKGIGVDCITHAN